MIFSAMAVDIKIIFTNGRKIFMKKTSKVISIIISIFMLMQVVPCMAAEGESESIECPCAVKVCYDLGIMPDVYENANKIVSRADLERVCTNLFEDTYRGGDDTNVSLEQICDRFAGAMVPGGASLPTMGVQLRSGVELGLDSYVSYAQLAKIVYNALNSYFRVYSGKFLIDESGQMFREGQDDVEGGLLYVKGYARYK